MKAIWDMALELLKACDLMDRSNIEDPTRRAIFTRDGDPMVGHWLGERGVVGSNNTHVSTHGC